MKQKSQSLSVFLLLLFLSGACGLVYEILWSRYLALFLGNTSLAHTFVLAAFMMGLALGGVILGSRADKHSNPLAFYGWLEMGVALWCGLYPSMHRGLESVYFSMVNLETPAGLRLAIQAFLSLAVLLPPAMLMGGTLPALSRFFIRRKEDIEKTVGALYAANSLGAVCGTLAAGFFMLRYLGVEASMLIAALFNAAVGAAALYLSRHSVSHSGESRNPDEENLDPGFHRGDGTERTVLLAAIGLSGACAMIYELAWTRIFALVLGSSTYAFSLMLAAFILGIVGGAAAIFWKSKHLNAKRSRILFALSQMGIAAFLALTLPFYDRLPYEFGRLLVLMKKIDFPFWAYQGSCFFICFALMFVPTFLSGLCLPLASRLTHSRLKFLGSEIGSVFAFNTLGTVFGAAMTGLILIPVLGIEKTFLLGMALSLINGFAVFAAPPRPAASRRLKFIAALPLILFLAYLAGPRWHIGLLNSGEFRKTAQHASMLPFGEFLEQQNKRKILYQKDGANGTVIVEEWPEGRILRINGKVDASSKNDLPTQLLLGHLPMVLKGQQLPSDVLVIGLGSAITAGAVLRHPLARVDAVEISPEVAKAARYFSAYNNNALGHPRLKLYLEDAKAFLRMAGKQYDVIISEPSNPWMAGIGGLFSSEHFEQAKKSLKPGGMIIQWFHLYEMDESLLRMLVRTMQKSFPHVSLWSVHHSDVILLGSQEPLPKDFQAMERVLKEPAVNEDLKRTGAGHLAAILSMQTVHEAAWGELIGRGPVNSDYFPYLEFEAPKAFYRSGSSDFLSDLDIQRWVMTEKSHTLLSRYLGGRELTLPELKSMIAFYGSFNGTSTNPSFYPSLLELAMRRGAEGRKFARKHLIEWNLKKENTERALKLLEEEVKEPSVSVDTLLRYTDLMHRQARQTLSSFNHPSYKPLMLALDRCFRLDPSKTDTYLHRKALIHLDWGEPKKALQTWEKALMFQKHSKQALVPLSVIKEGLDRAHLMNEIHSR